MGKKYVTPFLPRGYHTMAGEMCSLSSWKSHFTNMFIELMINRFKWKNLPDEIDPRYLELSLLTSGSVVFFWDYVKGWCALQGAWSGLDDYFNPIDFHVVTPSGFSPHVTKEEGVLIWSNFTRTSDMPTIWLYADTMAELYVSAMVNTKGQKHPIVVLVDEESQRLTLENSYAKLDGNHPVVYLDRKANIHEAFTTIDARVPFVAPEIIKMAKELMNDLFQWAGIRVGNNEKKANIHAPEQRDKNAVTWQLRNRGLHARQLACEQINKKFGDYLPLGQLEVEFDEEGIMAYVTDMQMSLGLGGEEDFE